MVTNTGRFQLNRKTAAQWTAANTVLLAGEAGVELDTGRAKFGDGSTAWTSLPYPASTGGGGAVSSVNGESGDVVISAADIGLGLVTNTSDANKPVSTAQAAALATKVTYPTGGVDGQALVKSGTGAGWATIVGGPGGSGGLNSSTDRIRYVSKAGADGNSGLGWDAAKLTVAAAITSLNGPGTIYIGGGTYAEANLNPNGATLVGTGWRGTTLQLAASGTLITTTAATNDGCIANLTLTFASSAVTGTLLDLNGSFKMQFYDVRFLGSGTNTAGQRGVWIRQNAGDHHFMTCKWESLNVGLQIDSTVSYLMGGIISGCGTGIQGGVVSGSTTALNNPGLVVNNVTFLGTSDFNINIVGSSHTWMITNCWFDGHATVPVQVGQPGTTNGPKMFVLSQIPYISAPAGGTCVRVYACNATKIDDVRFDNGTGGNPTELAFPNPTAAAKGHLGFVTSAQGTNLNSLIPTGWTHL